MCYYFSVNKKCSIPYEVLCHCERSVAISRKGYLVKAMMRCFCLRQKRCTFGAMCASGTLRIYSPPKKSEF